MTWDESSPYRPVLLPTEKVPIDGSESSEWVSTPLVVLGDVCHCEVAELAVKRPSMLAETIRNEVLEGEAKTCQQAVELLIGILGLVEARQDAVHLGIPRRSSERSDRMGESWARAAHLTHLAALVLMTDAAWLRLGCLGFAHGQNGTM